MQTLRGKTARYCILPLQRCAGTHATPDFAKLDGTSVQNPVAHYPGRPASFSSCRWWTTVQMQRNTAEMNIFYMVLMKALLNTNISRLRLLP